MKEMLLLGFAVTAALFGTIHATLVMMTLPKARVWLKKSGAEKKRELPPNSTLNRFSRKKLTPMAVISMEIFDA